MEEKHVVDVVHSFWQQPFLQAWFSAIASSVVLLFFGWIFSGWFSRFVKKALDKAKVEQSLAGFVASAFSYSLKILILIAVLANLGVDTTSLAAIVGATGLAIGFALRNTLSNVASGILLVSIRPYSVGDFIDAGNQSGTVEAITVFYTRLLTSDGLQVYVPNSAVFSGSITNYSRMPKRRWQTGFRLPYDADWKKAYQSISETVAANQSVMKTPAVNLVISDVEDNGVTIMLRVWLPTKGFRGLKLQLLEEIYQNLSAAGIALAPKYRAVV